ncbi:Ig-like domain-containing protein [Pseudophaeobacter profundi]|uniref:Ig-like domain-containing protein n=1 Tax=Pseudophaeobacter profundi TaxID=3034152 RepID=UPI002432F444|nr:Ig-like domain-containing protein [Pseudophaeobacter profundi]
MVTLEGIAAAGLRGAEMLCGRSVMGAAMLLALFAVGGEPALALDRWNGGSIRNEGFGTCRIEMQSSGTGAQVRAAGRDAGGYMYSYYDGSMISRPAITETILEDYCSFTSVRNLVQSTPAASYAAEDWFGFEFEFVRPGDGLYRGRHGLTGATGTQLVSEETLLDPVPTVTLSGLSGTFINPQIVTATFSETVDGFDASDIQVTNATISSFAGSGATYTFTVAPDGPGTVTVQVPAHSVTDSVSLPNPVSNTLSGTAETVSVTADFTANPGFGISVPHTVFFTDQSSSTPPALKTWNWDFGDGDTSTSQNPIHTYMTFGTFSATLETCVYTTCDTKSMTIEVVDVPATMTPSLSGFSGNVVGAQTVTVEFNAGVDTSDALQLSDFDATNLTLSNLSAGSPTPAYGQTQTYTLTATPDGDGAISLTLPAGAVSNFRSVANTASNTLSGVVDTTAPTITLVDAGASTTPYVGYRSVVEYPSGTIFVLGYSATFPDTVVRMGRSILPDNKMRYTIVPQRDGPVHVTFPAGMFRDVAGNLSAETRIDLGYADVDEPRPEITGMPTSVGGAFDATITFSKTVEGFTGSDIQISGGTLSSLAGSGANYTARITPDGSASITISIPADAAQHVAVAGVPGVFSVAAAPVSTVYNTTPVANAGPDQVVQSGADVTLDGSASADPNGDALTYHWSAPAGVTLSDATMAQPSFAAPTLSPGDPDKVLSITLTVDDGTETHQDTVGVTVMAQVAATLSGLPSDIRGTETITVSFSRDVTGFDEADLQLQNLTLSAFSASSPSSYQFDVTPVARGPVSITLPAGVAQDSRGNTNAVATLSATGFTNEAPVADAGSDQVAGGGVLVTLDGSGSTDPDGDSLSYRWTPPAGISLSDPAAAQPSFTTPGISPGDPDQELDFTLTVDDGTETHSDQVRIILRTDVSVTLAGLPNSFSGPGQHQINIQFSRAVTGLTASDLVISGGEVQSLSGNGATYQAQLRASGQGDLAVSLPAGVAQDSNGIPNAASNEMTAVNRIVEQTSQLIAGFMQARTNNLISNQPRVADFLLGRSTGNQMNAAVTRGRFNMDMAIAPQGGAWGTFRAAVSESDGQDSGYALATIGRHIEVKPNLLLGAMLQLDYAETTEGPAEVDGYGWLVGPYAVYRLPDQPVIFSARILYGQSNNDIAPLGTYRDQFKTERWLAQLGITGEVISGGWSVFPFLTASHARDDQHAYTDSLGNTIPAQGFQLTNLELGADFELQLARETGQRVLTGGLSGIWSATSGSGAAALREPAYEGGRLRLELGYGGVLPGGGRFQFNAFGDGIGARGYASYGVEGTYSFAF